MDERRMFEEGQKMESRMEVTEAAGIRAGSFSSGALAALLRDAGAAAAVREEGGSHHHCGEAQDLTVCE